MNRVGMLLQQSIVAFCGRASVLLLVASIMSACGGGDGTGVASPPTLPPPPPASGTEFSDIQANVFTPNCATAGCHVGAGAPQGLILDEANSYTLLVGVASNEVPTILRVAVGDPDNSYLIQKLEGTAGAGAQMPLNAPPLAQATIDNIRQWITDGAIDDRVSATSPIRVTSLSPVSSSSLNASPTRIMAGFDREVDASTVNANTFILEASGGDNTFGDGNETAIAAPSISVPGANPESAVFDLTGVELTDDTYRVTLSGSGPSMIMDLDANVLDGEFGGAFPSGDGIEGGDFEATFKIDTPVVIGPTLNQIQAVVFTPTCATASCHTGPTSDSLPSGMDLSDADASFAALVGVPSLQQQSRLRVEAGDPDKSYLIQKLEGDAGSQMPLGGPALEPSVIAQIRQWIDDGAQR